MFNIDNIQVSIDSSVKNNDSVVIFLPGISGNVFSNRFTSLSDACNSAGFDFMRTNIWNDADDLQDMTLNELCKSLIKVVDYCSGNRYKNIVIIGKSFGGGLAMCINDIRVNKKILLAPAFKVSTKSTLGSVSDLDLREVFDSNEIVLSVDDIRNDSACYYIVHGTKDKVISLKNSEYIIDIIDNGVLKVIDVAGHSFKSPKEEIELNNSVVEVLSEFFQCDY
jgi:esterase/lipase